MNRWFGSVAVFLGIASLAAAIVLFPGLGTGHAADQHKFLNILKSQGFEYQRGSLIFPDIISMCCGCELPSCWANNASSKYGSYLLPAAPGQTALNPMEESWTPPGQTNTSIAWRLRADEAIVFIGKTPPRMTYFGFVSYLYDRAGEPAANPVCTPLPNSLQNRSPEVFASLHDTINNMTIKCSGPPHDPFSKDTIIITAADKRIAFIVTAALLKAGYPKSIINLDVVSSSLVRLGVDQDADSLQSMLRLAPTHPDSEALQAYMKNPGSLWRLTPKLVTPPDKLNPLPAPGLRTRGTGRTEIELLPAVEDMERAIISTYSDYTADALPTTNWFEGYNCIQRNENCLADNRDTIYIMVTPESRFLLGNDEFIMVYGVNHAATGKAAYSNFTVTGGDKMVGAGAVRSEDFPGSAAQYSNSDEVLKLYAWKIAREGGCGGDPYCLEIKENCQNSGIPVDQKMSVAFRAYLEHSTAVGPAYGELVVDRVIKFSRKQ